MQTSDRPSKASQISDWLAGNSGALPRISPQDLEAMDALFENLDSECVDRDLLTSKPPAIDLIEWDLVDLIA